MCHCWFTTPAFQKSCLLGLPWLQVELFPLSSLPLAEEKPVEDKFEESQNVAVDEDTADSLTKESSPGEPQGQGLS